MKIGSHKNNLWEEITAEVLHLDKKEEVQDTWVLLYMIQCNEGQKPHEDDSDDFETIINDKNVFESNKYVYVFINIATSNIIVLSNRQVVNEEYPVKKALGLRVDRQVSRIIIHTRIGIDLFNERYVDSRFYNDKSNVHIEQTGDMNNIEDRLKQLAYNTKESEYGYNDIKFDLKTNAELLLTQDVKEENEVQIIDIVELQYCRFVQAYKELNETDREYKFITPSGKHCQYDMAIYFDKYIDTILIRIPDLKYITDLAIRKLDKSKASRIYSIIKTGQYIDISKISIDNVVNANKMFSGLNCESINLHELKFDSVKKIRKMLMNCDIDTLDISNLDLGAYPDIELQGLFTGSTIRRLRLNLGENAKADRDTVHKLSLIFDGITKIPDDLYINIDDYKNDVLRHFGKRVEHSNKWVCSNSIGGGI